MAQILVRNVEDRLKSRLQRRARSNGRSMEAEVRELLSQLAAIEPPLPTQGLGTAIHNRFAALGGVELEIPPRQFSSRQGKETVQSNARPPLEEDFGTAIHKLFAPLGGVELEIPPRRKSHRPIPTFE